MVRAPEPSAAPSGRWGLGLLVAALALALVVRLALAARNSGLTMDSPLYVRMAEALVRGERGASPAHHGYPILIALASRVIPGREWPARLVSLVASLGLVAIVGKLAARRLPVAWAMAAAVAVAVHPLLAVYGGAIMTEAAFLAVTFAGLALVEAGRGLAGGLVLGAAYWIRPEAAVIAPLAAALTPGPVRDRLRVVAGAAVVALAYAVLLREQQGFWSLTPKTALVRAPFANERAAEWHLGDTTAVAETLSLAARLRSAGPAMLAGYGPALMEHLKRLLEAWPAPWLVLSLAGLTRRASWAPALAPLACVLVYPLLAAPADLRFSQLAVPSLVLLAAAGGEWLATRGRLARGGVLALALAGAVLAATGPMRARALAFDDGPMASLRGAGEWLRAHGRPEALVMDRKSYVPFFAGMRHVQLPNDSLSGILAYARATGVDYLVVEEYVARSFRPQLRPLLDPSHLAHEPRVRLLFALQPAPNEGVAIFEIVQP